MSQFLVSRLRVRKCRKATKLDAKINRSMLKVAKSKRSKELNCAVNKDKVVFKGKNKVLIRKNIEKTRKDKANKVIAVAAKAVKKNHSQIFVMKFPNDDEFERFYEALNPEENKNIDSGSPASCRTARCSERV